MPGLRKRSINLRGHATSVALEPAFWEVIENIARMRKISLAALIAELDEGRGERLLASYCRLTALAHVQRGAIKRPIAKSAA